MSEFEDLRFLVTGHTGFKGAWLCRILNKAGAEIHGISLPPTSESLIARAKGIQFKSDKHIDINNRSKVESLIRHINPDFLIHLAAQPIVRRSYREPVETFATNVLGTANVLNAALGCQSLKGVVAVTTDKVYRNIEKLEGYREDDPLGGTDPYSASKSASEMVINAWQNLSRIKFGPGIVAARSGNVIGGGDYSEDRLFPDLMRGLLSKNVIEIRNPESLRPWQHVMDPLFGYLLIASKLIAGESISNAFNFGPSENSKLSVAEMVDTACKLWPNNHGWRHVPGPEDMPESKLLWLSSERSESELGWRNKLDAKEAIKWTVDWETMAQDKGVLFALDAQIEKYLELN